ncbi:MAG: YpdA family putative bacillithiol disulfide reductase [Rhizobacter sp.]|nr:YpdA family putative bacillithiol disulfide reductase [Chlorobiales bacterium]
MTDYDILIIGGGPVGLACGIEAKTQGLSHIIIEKGNLVNSFLNWPTYMVFFSTAELLEIGDVPWTTAGEKPTRREGFAYYRKVKEKFKLNLHTYEEVLGVKPNVNGFEVATSKQTYTARNVVVATGFSEHVNPLGAPGEDLPKVSHIYREAFPYAGCEVLVVGGKNSAAETALDLWRHGAKVTMAVRKPQFGESLKYWMKPDLENRIKQGQITAHFNTVVEAITDTTVVLYDRKTLRHFTIKNDFVLAMTGYQPSFEFLKKLGVGVTENLRFTFDRETMETNVAGLYLAGVVAAGIDTGSLFIENGRLHAKQIVSHILKQQTALQTTEMIAAK